jgi:hypothetical protein
MRTGSLRQNLAAHAQPACRRSGRMRLTHPHASRLVSAAHPGGTRGIRPHAPRSFPCMRHMLARTGRMHQHAPGSVNAAPPGPPASTARSPPEWLNAGHAARSRRHAACAAAFRREFLVWKYAAPTNAIGPPAGVAVGAEVSYYGRPVLLRRNERASSSTRASLCAAFGSARTLP